MTSMIIKDGNGSNQTFGVYLDSNGDLTLGHTPLVSGQPVSSTNPLPASQSGTWSVNVNNFPSTQAVSWSGQSVTLSAGSAAIGSVSVTALPAIPAGSNAIGSVSVSNSITTNDGGAAGTGISQPTGGSGLTGWLSAIAQALRGTLTITGAISNLGSIGTDGSSNAPAGPGTATAFSYNGATLNLLATRAANPNRRGIEVINTSGSLIVLVIDDGSNTSTATSLLPLTAGSAQFQQGSEWNSNIEQGRVRVFGTTGTFVYVREN